jgi:carboxypeptidase family protein
MKLFTKLGFASALLLAFFAVPQLSAQRVDSSPIQSRTRTLVGMVQEPSGQPVKDAVVYLKDTKTLAVKSYIVGDDGKYRFHALLATVDYEVHAEKQGKRSENKVLSSFDSRKEVTINLQIE